MKLQQILNLIAVIATVAVNSLANIIPFNGQTTGEISDAIPTLFTPAGYVFSIWSLIYLGLFAFAIYQILPGQRDKPYQDRIGYWFVISSVFNIAWIFLWHYELFLLTLIVMLGLLVSLLVIYLRLGIGRREVSTAERWLVHLPFSIYLGWISVATIANVSAVLYTAGWGGWGISPEIWTVLVIIVGGALGIAMALSRREVAYPLVIVWAFAGIVVARPDVLPVAIAAGVMAGIVFLVTIAARLLRRSPGASAAASS
jgi:hypothetical protein